MVLSHRENLNVSAGAGNAKRAPSARRASKNLAPVLESLTLSAGPVVSPVITQVFAGTQFRNGTGPFRICKRPAAQHLFRIRTSADCKRVPMWERMPGSRDGAIPDLTDLLIKGYTAIPKTVMPLHE